MPENESPVITGFQKSPTIGELTKALAAAHKDFKPVLKDANNPFFKSKYADLAGVIDATGDALSAHDLAVIQSPGRIANGHIFLTTLLSHSSGEWVKDELELPISKFDAQGTGSAITYARRYAYQAIVGVAAEDDDGDAASQKFEKQPDGNFARGSQIGYQNAPPAVANSGKLAGTENVQPKPEPAKPKGRPKKESVPDAGKPWGGEFEAKTATTPGSPVQESPVSVSNGQNIHGLVIVDSEVPFPGDPKPETRLPTESERKAFMDRLIVLKNKGFTGIREYLLKESGETITNNIAFARMSELVDKLEAAEKAGNLKELLK